MKAYLIVTLSIIQISLVNGQTFSECSERYDLQFKKLQTQVRLNQLDKRGSDSVIFLLEKELEDCIIGKELPDINLVARSGKVYTNESLKGKIVIFNFWSVSCVPCLMEIPVLNRLHQAYKGNPDVIFISILYDNEENLVKFTECGSTKRRIAYEVVPDSRQLMKSNFKLVKAYPTNIFVDREGKVFMITSGGVTDRSQEEGLEEEFRYIIDKELSRS